MNVWLTPAQVALKSGRHKSTVYEALESGELHGHQRKRGGRWQVHVAAVDAWIRGTDQHVACGCPPAIPIRRRRTA